MMAEFQKAKSETLTALQTEYVRREAELYRQFLDATHAVTQQSPLAITESKTLAGDGKTP